MAADGYLNIAFQKNGSVTSGMLKATAGDELLHQAHVNLSNRDEVDGFVRALCDGRPGVIPSDVSAAVQNILAETHRCDPSGQSASDSAAMRLVQLAEGLPHFHDGINGYVTITEGRTSRHLPVRHEVFRDWLLTEYRRLHASIPGTSATASALQAIEAMARRSGPAVAISRRVAGGQQTMWLDLANASGEVVEVTAAGWRIVSDVPVKFLRPPGLLPLPRPAAGGDLRELAALLNLRDGRQFQLVVAFLLGVLRPEGPFPLLAISGEQGSAKSTFSRLVRSLVDPSAADLLAPPRNEEELMIMAANGHLLAFDNVSNISNAMADALCRLATGGTFAKRRLFTNDEQHLIRACRPVILNGIPDLLHRPDLADRSIGIELPPIADQKRLAESDLRRKLDELQPGLLGGLLDAVSTALRRLPDVTAPALPRMADFVRWVMAAEPALPWTTGTFAEAYAANRSEVQRTTLDNSPIGPLLLEVVPFAGRVGELLAILERAADPLLRRDRGWPRTARDLGEQVRRLTGPLRSAGVVVTFPGRDKCGRRVSLESDSRASRAPRALEPHDADEG